MKTSPRRQILADLLLLGVTAIWGGTFVMVKDAVSGYPVFGFLAIRFALASLTLLLFCARRLRGLSWRDWGAGALIGLFLFAGYALQTIGLQYASASKAGLITGLSVVLVPLLAGLIGRQKPQGAAILGVVLATVGLGLLTVDPSDGLAIEPGDLILLGCAMGFAAHIVAVSVAAPRVDPLALTWVQVTMVAVLSMAIALVDGTPWQIPTSKVWYAAAFTGVLATALAFALQNIMQQFTTSTHTALIFAAEPVFAALFGVLLAGESLLPRGIAGGILIVFGTMISEIPWADALAERVARWLGPPVLAAPVLFCLAWVADGGWVWHLVWSVAVWLLAVWVPHMAESRRARWEPSVPSATRARLRWAVLALLMVLGPAAAALFAWRLGGPRYAVAMAGVLLISRAYRLAFPHGAWSSARVAWATAAATALVAVFGVVALPSVLLVPLVGWATVRSRGVTLWRSVTSGVAGVLVTIWALVYGGIIG